MSTLTCFLPHAHVAVLAQVKIHKADSAVNRYKLLLIHMLKQALHAGLGFAECTARVTPLADDELTVDKPYLKEREQVQTRGWVYYAFNVTDEDYQVVVNVAEEEGSECKLLCPQPLMPEDTLSCLPVQLAMYAAASALLGCLLSHK